MTTSFQIPSRSFAGSHTVRFDERAGRWTCTCQGFHRWHHREGFACFHIRKIQDGILSAVLLIEGDLPFCLLETAISDMQSGLFLMREFAYYDHHRAARYGYVPKHGPDWKARIGLQPDARRELLEVEVSAVIASLARRIEAVTTPLR